jgi:hypothetical protein
MNDHNDNIFSIFQNQQLNLNIQDPIPELFVFLSYHKKIIKFVSREPDKILIQDPRNIRIVPKYIQEDPFDGLTLDIDEEFDALAYSDTETLRGDLRHDEMIILVREEIKTSLAIPVFTRTIVKVLDELSFNYPVVKNFEYEDKSLNEICLLQEIIQEHYYLLLENHLFTSDMSIYYQYIVNKSQFHGIELTHSGLSQTYIAFANVFLTPVELNPREIFLDGHYKNVSKFTDQSYKSDIFRYCMNNDIPLQHPQKLVKWVSHCPEFIVGTYIFRTTEPVCENHLRYARAAPEPVIELLILGYDLYLKIAFYKVPERCQERKVITKKPILCFKNKVKVVLAPYNLIAPQQINFGVYILIILNNYIIKEFRFFDYFKWAFSIFIIISALSGNNFISRVLSAWNNYLFLLYSNTGYSIIFIFNLLVVILK